MIATETTCHLCGAPVDLTRQHGRCARCLFAEAFALPMADGVLGVIGGHQLIAEIARGGMGVVYHAHQREPARDVALKTMHGAELDSPEALVRFRSEATAMADLEHAAILPVFTFGEHDGVPFFTMKLATGGTLAERLGAYAGKWREMAELLETVAGAVQHAHTHGVLHRDLKPGNILFDESGHVFVSDFGIAKLLDSAERALTRTAAVLGTPHYLAPEIAAHDSRAATTASDVWSLGVMLYELLGQRRPFEGESVSAVLRAITDTEPAPLREGPRDLAVIAGKALAREPARRYRSALELAGDLRRWLDGRPITARPVSPVEKLQLWARRNPVLSAVSALALCALLAAFASLTWGLRRAREESHRANSARAESQSRLREALLERARAGRVAGLSGWREKGVAGLREAAAIRDGPDVLSEAIAQLAGLDLELGRELPLTGNLAPTPAFDLFASVVPAPGGFVVSFANAAGDSQGPPVSVDWAGAVSGEIEVWFSARGERLAVQQGSAGVVLIDVPARKVMQQWPEASFCGFSDDGALCAVLLNRDRAAVYRTADVAEAGALPGSPKRTNGWYLGRLQPCTDSALIVLASHTMVELWNWRDQQMISSRKVDERVAQFAWSGDFLAVAGREMFQITLWNLRTGRMRALSTDGSRPATLVFSPNARLLAGTSGQGATSVAWDTTTGQTILRSTQTFPQCFAADGRRFLHGEGGRWRLGEVRKSEAVRSINIAGLSQGLAFLDISPDGRWLLLNSRALSGSRTATGLTTIWELPSLRLAATLEGAFSRSLPVYFLADSIHVAGVLATNAGVQESKCSILRLEMRDGTLVTSDRRDLGSIDQAAFTRAEASPSRRWLAFAATERVLLFDTHEPSTPREFTAAGFADFVHSPAWNESAHKLDAAPAGQRALWPPSLFSPDGLRYVRREAEQLCLHDAISGRLIRACAVAAASHPGVPAAWSPDGRWLVFSHNHSDMTLLEAATGAVVAELAGPLHDPINALRFTPDGRSIVLLRDAGLLERWDLPRLAAELAGLGLHLELPPPIAPAPPGLPPPMKPVELPRLNPP